MLKKRPSDSNFKTAWEQAREQAREHLISVAKKKKALITYGDLAKKITARTFKHPRFVGLDKLLGEISEAEHHAGRGMLTALVVNKSEGEPGRGFYKLARELKFGVSGNMAKGLVWASQLHKVWTYWGRSARP